MLHTFIWIMFWYGLICVLYALGRMIEKIWTSWRSHNG